jgi:hypothetical protein
MDIDESLCLAIRVEVEDSLKDLGHKYGIEFSVAQHQFAEDFSAGKFAIKMMRITAEGERKPFTDPPEVLEFRKKAFPLGFTEQHLGCKFTFAGNLKIYRIVGWRKGARVSPILAENDKGKRYIFRLRSVMEALSIPVPKNVK